MTDIASLSAAEIGRRIEAGALDAREATEAFLAAIAAHPDRARIFVRVHAGSARAEADAAAARAKAGLRRGPLDGVPLSWKDLFDWAGQPTEAGSRMLEGRTPAADARVLANARAGGAVALGQTHMTELAFSGLGINPVAATPPNRFDPALAPGGSSSGAAASVAFGLAAAGIGSDTGGSVRLPAAWNSLVGLKTTWGRLSSEGVVLLAEGYDTVGPLCRTVEDAALLLALLEAGRPADLNGATLAGARLAVLETVALDESCRAAPRAAFEAAVAALARAGATVERLEAPEVPAILAVSGALIPAEAWAEWGETIEARGFLMFPPIRERFRAGAAVSAAEHLRAMRARNALRAAWNARTAGFDAVLLPSSAILPPVVAEMEADHARFAAENLLALRNTRIGNLLGVSAVTLPTAAPMCGLMAMGRPMGEAALLRFAAAAEPVVAAAG